MFNPKTGRLFCQTYTGKDGGGGFVEHPQEFWNG